MVESRCQVFLSFLDKEGGQTARSLGAALLLVQSLVNRVHAGEPCLRQLHDAVTRVNTTVSTRQVQLAVLDSVKTGKHRCQPVETFEMGVRTCMATSAVLAIAMT